MDSYEHTPQYYRARIDVYREAIAAIKSDDPDIAVLRNGVMRDKAHEQMLVEGKLREQEYPKTPLSFIELCTFNTWFAMHAEKVCGKEVITSSREFPLSIKGDRQWIENTISHATGEDRLILPVPFEWSLKYFEDDDPDFDVEYTNGKYTARIYQGGVDFNLQITEGDRLLENINFKHIAGANLHLMRFMQENRGTASSSTLELEALALEIELQISDL